jgi:hypothetical protein
MHLLYPVSQKLSTDPFQAGLKIFTLLHDSLILLNFIKLC